MASLLELKTIHMIRVSLIMVLCSTLSYAQQRTTADYILEGGNLVLDIFRIAKNDKMPQRKQEGSHELQSSSKELQTSNEGEECAESSFCFSNKTEGILKVELRRKNKSGGYYSQVYELVISPEDTECVLALVPGVYMYKIMQIEKDNKTTIVKQGDIQLDEQTKLRKNID